MAARRRRAPALALAARALAALALAALALGAAGCAGPAAQAPAVVPAAAAAPADAAGLALQNGGFEVADGNAMPAGWEAGQHAGDVSYHFVLDRALPHAGAAALRIDGIGAEPFGSVWQVLPAAPVRRRTVVLSGWLRALDASGNAFGTGGALLLQALRGSSVVAEGALHPAAASGTTRWQRYEARLAVPAEADSLRVGVTLYGRGTVWADELVLAMATP